MKYTAKTFTIPSLNGISEKTITEHIKLYEGYVKHVNVIYEKVTEMASDAEKNAYAISEVRRRLGFEFGGMKNHEYYFSQFEGGPASLGDGALKDMIASQWGSVEVWHERFAQIAMTRGVGWAMLYFDTDTKQLVHAWVDEQHLGQLATADIILALDMWEHSYMLDYVPSEKKKYIEAFFANLNWKVCEERFAKLS
jgi:superoxide dismutase, Fe-Mn family